MPSLPLICHPATPTDCVRRFDVTIGWRDVGELQLCYTVQGDIGKLSVPAPDASARRDLLWEHTCVEAFMLVPGSDGYREFNFSPSTEWACYHFTGYRRGMISPPVDHPPRISVQFSSDRLDVEVLLTGLAEWAEMAEIGPIRLGLSAVLEDTTGVRSYWALRQSSKQPDFHDPASFALTLDRIAGHVRWGTHRVPQPVADSSRRSPS